VTGPNEIVWRKLTGSGNETAGHLAQINRMTLIWCRFGAKPMILRTYATASTLHPRDAEFAALDAHFDPYPGARQIYVHQVYTAQTSCGYAVPFMEFTSDRPVLDTRTKNKSLEGIAAYRESTNQETIDGAPTYSF
jgi:hypothetical protein